MTRKNTEKKKKKYFRRISRAGSVSDGNTHPLGARSKGSNGVVAVGLPHRNYSVFKQTPINQWQIKVVVVKTRASEAKGPFPGGKRVGSRGKRKIKKEKEKEKGVGRAPAD